MDIVKIQRLVRKHQAKKPRIRIDLPVLPLSNKLVYRCYDIGARFCFRIGKSKFSYWKYPWSELIGTPTRQTLDEWFDLINTWKIVNEGKYDRDDVDNCIRRMLCYI